MCYEQPFSKVKIAPAGVQEIIGIAFRRAMRAEVNVSPHAPPAFRARRKEEAKIRSVGEYVIRRLNEIRTSMPFIDGLHPFYRDLACVLVDVDRIKMGLARMHGCERVIGKLLREYVLKVRSSFKPTEAAEYRRAFLGRVASILRDVDSDLKYVRECQLKLVKLPSISPEVPTIVVAGPPNVGKSTLVNRISSAKPEIREYPFTTKGLILGHIGRGGGAIQVLDTPGLLDRPLSERNKIELQAILALKHVASAIIFILDPTETCGYPLEYQVNVYDDIRNTFDGIPIIVALNKSDIAKPEQMERAISKVRGISIFIISSLDGRGIGLLMENVLSIIGK